jgi:hypothetical protein
MKIKFPLDCLAAPCESSGWARATAIADESGREPAGGWDFSCSSSVPLVIRPAGESAAATREQ